ncbi:MAG: FKBP-type peptidyl-prolyl cis-trans isomerase [Dehalococcoidia bacterium]
MKVQNIRALLFLGVIAVLATGILGACSSGESASDSEKQERAETGDTVKVHYTGRFQEGTVFDSSAGSEPMEFTLGDGQLIPGFEQAVAGMVVGGTKTVTIPSEEAYGPRRDDMVQEASRDELPQDLKPEVGMLLEMRQPDGTTRNVTVTDVTETTLTIDANHPLAGKDLTFDIELVDIVTAQSGASGLDLASISLKDCLASGTPTLAEFGRGTCIPCKKMKPILEELAVEYKGEVNIVFVEIQNHMDLTRSYSIMAIPTQIFFDSNGEEVSRHIGFYPKEDIVSDFLELGMLRDG